MNKRTAKDIIQLCDSATTIIEQLLSVQDTMNGVIVRIVDATKLSKHIKPYPRSLPPMSIFETMKARAEEALKEQSNED